MTTEDDFQAALDVNPEDWQTRLVFADWLQERNDPRAEGYRALGTLQRWPNHSPVQRFPWEWWNAGPVGRSREADPDNMEGDWFYALSRYGRIWGDPESPASKDYSHRRTAEDDAALSFTTLDLYRRTELLARGPDDDRG